MAQTQGIRPTTAQEAVLRAWMHVGNTKIRYRLGGGGRNPRNTDPGSTQLGGDKACDCVGFTCWCVGMDRFQTIADFPSREGWCNCDAVILDAKGPCRFYKHVPSVAEVQPGDLLVYGGIYEERELERPDGSIKKSRIRVKPGHICLVVKAPPSPQRFDDLRVIHCSSGHDKKLGFAIAESDGYLWRKTGGIAVRYTRFEPPP